MGLAGAACFLAGVGFLIALLLGSVILRAAVALANRSAGPVKVKPADLFPDWDWDGEPEDAEPRLEKAIPEPGLGKGMMIASTIGVLTALLGVVLGILLDDLAEALFGADEAVQLVGLMVLTVPFSFAAATLLLVVMLPAPFWRAALVAFLYHVFATLVLALVFGAVVVFLRL